MSYDFAGWVTYHDIRCSDGAIIKGDAFEHQDGDIVSLSWNHKGKEDPTMILGHMELEVRPEGIWGYGSFNDTDIGQHARELVLNGDIDAMSIGANRIKRDPLQPSNVVDGNIYEVSLVQTGANPLATIEEVVAHSSDEGASIRFTNGFNIFTPNIEHSDDEEDNNYQGEQLMSIFDTIRHSDDASEVLEHAEAILEELDDEDQAAIAVLLEAATDATAEATAEQIYNSEEIQTLVEAAEAYNELMEELDALEDEDEDDVEHGGFMRRNLFTDTEVIEHAASVAHTRDYYKDLILGAQNDIKGQDITLGDYVEQLQHSDIESEIAYGETLEHALRNVELLFPEFTTVNGVQFHYSKDTATEEIMSGVTKYPTAFVRTLAADLSDLNDEDLRAKGYIKGNEKKEQIFGFIERRTQPQTIYKKQSIDRDDEIDMSKNLDIQMVYRTELKTKINDEIVRCILVGDGRQPAEVDKVREDRIRPIRTDDDFFTVKRTFNKNDLSSLSETIDLAMIDMDGGSGTPAMIVSPRLITQIRHIKDKDGLFLYGGRTPASLKDLADLFGVSKIIKSKFLGDDEIIIVNLADYGIGHENGGQLTSFEHFDIHVNKKYFLMETRLSGALTRPHSALYLRDNGKSGVETVKSTSETNPSHPKQPSGKVTGPAYKTSDASSGESTTSRGPGG